MQLRIVSPEGEKFYGGITKLSVPTASGMMTILPHHLNVVTTLTSGKVSYVPVPSDDQEESALQEFSEDKSQLLVQGGVLLVDDEIVTLVVD